jgi:ABC-type dipeptide/oligopeptide/nickel transport system permease subunit
MLALVAVLVVIIPFTPGYDPMGQNLMIALEPPFTDAAHPLGTDPLGRDLLSRLSMAARVSVMISCAAVAISGVVGLCLGLLAGWRGGLFDRLMTAVGNIQLSIPIILLLIILVASFGANALLLVLLLGFTNWVGYGRVTRAQVLALKPREFVTSAIASGGSDFWILRRHLAPNVLPALLVLAAFDLGLVVTIESSLSFIGLGIQPPTASLGLMISEGQRYLQTDASLTVLPALVIFLLIGGIQIASQSLAVHPPAAR